MLDFSATTGALFPRLGKLGALIKNIRTHQNTQFTAMTSTSTGVIGQYNSESDLQALMGSAYLGILGGVEAAGNTAQGLASATIVRMVYRDNPLFGQTLTSGTLQAAVNEVIRQMKVQGATILNMTVGSSVNTFTGTGNGVVNLSTRRPSDGATLENIFAEQLTVKCIADSYTGNATIYNENLQITGQGNESDLFAFDWPLGSNGKVNLVAINGTASNTGGNLLSNSGFDTWSGGVPSDWTLTVGTAGTNIAQENTIVYRGTSSLQLIGDGSTLTALTQLFDSAANALTPLTQYSVCLFLRRDGVAPAAGTLIVELIDPNGVVIADAAGNNNTFTINLTGLNTVFTAYTGIFRTPTILPTTQRLRLRMGTALTNTRNVYVDTGSMGLMTQIYAPIGPYTAIHSGSSAFVLGDYAFCNTTNSRGSGGTLSTWQTLLYQLLPGIGSTGILFPSAASPSVNDNLIG